MYAYICAIVNKCSAFTAGIVFPPAYLVLYSDYAYPNKKEKTTYEGWGG